MPLGLGTDRVPLKRHLVCLHSLLAWGILTFVVFTDLLEGLMGATDLLLYKVQK